MSTQPTAEELHAFFEFCGRGTDLWTSEDGCRAALVIAASRDVDPHDDMQTCRFGLFHEFWWLKGCDWTKPLEPAFMEFVIDEEWRDGPGNDDDDRRAPIWKLTDGPTPFKVWKIEL